MDEFFQRELRFGVDAIVINPAPDKVKRLNW